VHEEEQQWEPKATAFVIVDMWNQHWCPSATDRVGALAVFINRTVSVARSLGFTIIHAPSDCSGFYSSYPMRKWVLSLPDYPLPTPKPHPDPAFPIDADDQGCDVPGAIPYQAWYRENELIDIGPNDPIIDDERNGQTFWNVIQAFNISKVVFLGVHANMCIMNRSFAIKNSIGWGLSAHIVREAVDTMYDPSLSPYVSHEEGTQLMVEFVEKFWAPSVSAYDFIYPRSS